MGEEFIAGTGAVGIFTCFTRDFKLWQGPKRLPRRSLPRSALRRNPDRSSRPHTRSRSLVEGPPSPLPEEEDDDRYILVRRRKMSDEYLDVC